MRRLRAIAPNNGAQGSAGPVLLAAGGDAMHEMEQEILGILRKSDISLTIEDVASAARINRITASKYLAVLEAKQLIAKREVGRAKLFYPAGARKR